MKWPQLIMDSYGKLPLLAAGVKVEVKGTENIIEGKALYVGNHQGLFDMFVVLAKMGKIKAFLAKKEAEKIPFVGSWMEMMGCVFIDRSNVRAAVTSVKQVEDRLNAGRSMIIFPEGTRSRGHKMGEFKPGAFKPALNTGAPIVPFVIDGSYKAWEETGKIRPCTIKLTILPPIETAGMENEKTRHIAETVKEKINEALN